MTEAQRAWLMAGLPENEDEPIDLDAVLRAWRELDDPTIAKNEQYYERESSEMPDIQLVKCYVPGRPFWIRNPNPNREPQDY